MEQHQEYSKIQWAVFAVLALIAIGLIARLFVGSSDAGQILVSLAVVSVMLVANVRIFDLGSLSFSKEGFKAELKNVADRVDGIRDQQHEQEGYLDSFFRILAERLSPPMKYHLRILARGGDETYEGSDGLRRDLVQLKRFGLIEEIPPQKIWDFLDGKKANVASFVRLTATGDKFIPALDKIEAE